MWVKFWQQNRCVYVCVKFPESVLKWSKHFIPPASSVLLLSEVKMSLSVLVQGHDRNCNRNDQEQGNERAEGRTGIEERVVAELTWAQITSRWRVALWVCRLRGGAGGRSSWGSVTVVGQGCHLELFRVFLDSIAHDLTQQGSAWELLHLPRWMGTSSDSHKAPQRLVLALEAGTQWVPCAGHLERGEASQDARDGKLTRAAEEPGWSSAGGGPRIFNACEACGSLSASGFSASIWTSCSWASSQGLGRFPWICLGAYSLRGPYIQLRPHKNYFCTRLRQKWLRKKWCMLF